MTDKLTEIVLASANQGKLKELGAMLAPLQIGLRSIAEWTEASPPEDAPTFVENALLKARHGCALSGLPCLADDSGLIVPALGGAPGVHSARYAALEDGAAHGPMAQRADSRATTAPATTEQVTAKSPDDDAGKTSAGMAGGAQPGGNASDEDNRRKLLQEMEGLEGAARQAYFVCVLVLLRHKDDPRPLIVSGEWHGSIARQEQGSGGFGYDPIFYLPELGRSAAELSSEQKNSLSHRGQASRQLIAELRNWE